MRNKAAVDRDEFENEIMKIIQLKRHNYHFTVAPLSKSSTFFGYTWSAKYLINRVKC